MRKIKFIHIVLAAMLLFLFSQCYYDEVLTEPLSTSIEGDVSFDTDIIPIFDASCNGSGCHNTGGTAPDLTPANAYNALISGSYINSAVPESSELYLWMTDKRDLPMPLTGPNATYNALVLEWIRQGALNN